MLNSQAAQVKAGIGWGAKGMTPVPSWLRLSFQLLFTFGFFIFQILVYIFKGISGKVYLYPGKFLRSYLTYLKLG